MNCIFLALAISTALTAPAFADTMAADVTCTAFLAMGPDDQMGAMTAAWKPTRWLPMARWHGHDGDGHDGHER